MTTAITMCRDQVLAELEALLDEYLPFALQLMRAFRESVTLKPAANSFRQGWRDVQRGETAPVMT
ncbi:MAG TPA: hypothetical protein VG324_24575, partial [Blastocatellia bacterium]|nr:hypothetical protein [Blastocatellia bacterium]